MKWFSNLSVKYKIASIAFIGIIGLAVSWLVNYTYTNNVKNQLSRTIESQLPTLQFINELQVGFAELQELYQSSLMTADEDTLLYANETARYLTDRFYDEKEKEGEYRADLSRLFDVFQDYTKTVAKHSQNVIEGTDFDSDATIRGFAEVDRLREEYENMQKEFNEKWYKDFSEDLAEIQTDQNAIAGTTFLIFLGVTLFLLLISWAIVGLITKVLNNAVDVADKIASGELDSEITVDSLDESGHLMNSLRVMRDSLMMQQTQASERDELQSALAGLNETMRGDQDVDVLAANVIEYLAEATKSSIGAVYLTDDEGLSLVASYAYTYRQGGGNSIQLGESIVGQCALERKTFVVNDLPDDYIKISSGTGKASPNSLLVFPIELDGQLSGVIELGSFRQFNDRDLEFIERGREGIGIAFNSAESRIQMAKILDQTRSQAQELQEQQEQMELINAELEERSKALDQQKNEILQKNNELERSKKVLLDKSKALEASDRYKTQFLSTMSHELRTPLNSILILSQALIDNKKGNLSDKEVQHAHVINSSGTDLLTLINDILDLSKIEEGKLDMVFEKTRLDDLSAELTKRFEFVAGDKGLEFKVNVEEGMPDSVVTDTHRMNQIVKNFISNAIKFTDSGGVYIDIHKPRAPFVPVQSTLSMSNSYVVAVRDTGVGIPKEKQDIIFEAFKQADGTTSRKYGGTGLGLTISRELSELLGGEISVYSKGEGEGSVFYMVLPFDSEAHINNSTPSVTAGATPVAEPPAQLGAVQEPAVAEADSADKEMEMTPEKAAILAAYENAGNTPAGSVEFGNKQFASAEKVDRILIVEDDEKFAQILNELILEAGLFCDLMYSGQDALTYLEHYEPQAVILDISLPDVSGWEVLKQIKNSRTLKKLPVHIVSAMPEKAQALNLGAEDFTEKPVSQNDVQDLLFKIKEEIGDAFNRVLLVEDNVALHDAISDQFANKGIELSIAANGEEGLKYVEDNGFDCMIVDLMLPDMDGVDLLRQVRALPEHSESPIIVFTAQELSTEREFEISKYADRVIIKSGQAMDRLVGAVSLFLSDVSTQGGMLEALVASAEERHQEAAAVQAVEEEPPAPVATVAPAGDTFNPADYDEYQDGELDGCTVLLVDDDIRNIYSLSSVLEINGLEVKSAMSGMEALDKLEEVDNGIQVVLMDIMMPEMDGYEAMRRIRKMSGYEKLPIIALTAKAMKEDRQLCIDAGASDYLSKPVDTDKLNRMLVTWLRRTPGEVVESAAELEEAEPA